MVRYILSELNSSVTFPPNIQVITPNRIVANRVRQLVDSKRKISHYSLESLAQNILCRQGLGIASSLLSRRLLQNSVRDVIKIKDIEGTAQAFLASIKDLFLSSVNLVLLQESSDWRIQQLSNLAIAYQQQLRQRKKIDRAELYWQIQHNIIYQKAYLFYGYFAPNMAELNLINAISGQNSILVLPQEDLLTQNSQGRKWLESQGWNTYISQSQPLNQLGQQLQQSFKNSKTLPIDVNFHTFPNLIAEIRGVLTQVKILLTKGVRAKDIVLVTREEQLYGETLVDIAWEYKLPLQVSYEIPLKKTRMGSWLILLLEVIRDNLPFETTAKLLAHPLAKYISSEIWQVAREKHPQGIERWQELGLDLNLLDLRKKSYSREFWLKRIAEILSAWNILEKGKAWARETVAYYKIIEALSELSQPQVQQLTKQALLNEINGMLELLTVPAQPGIGGIELHNPTSLLGTSYAHVFVLGAMEGVFPRAISDDPILDFHSRKQLAQQGFKIETAVDIAQRETFYFYSLLGIPLETITFSYPELVERTPSLPSSYLTRLGLKPSTVNAIPIASIEIARQSYLRQPNLLNEQVIAFLSLKQITKAWQVETVRTDPTKTQQYDGLIGISIDPHSKIFSVSQLTQLGQCPFKWFSARLLKLKELKEAELDLEAAIRGNLYHRTLELSLQQVQTAGDLAKFNQEQLAKAFEKAETELQLFQLPGWIAQRQEHLNLIALNLAAVEFLPPEREVVARETKFAMIWHGLQLQGQVDRIDRSEEGLTVIDYKTSSIPPAGVKDLVGKANLDIQLAVYQAALQSKSVEFISEEYSSEPVDNAVYYSLTQQKNIGRLQQDPNELGAFVERVKKHLQQGYYPIEPDVDKKACRYCRYDLVCRKN